jgi:WhiB family redox-sensing transcriptional regulator
VIDFDSLYGPCRRCGKPMASRSARKIDPTYVGLGSADGYCDSCHKINRRGRTKDFRRPPVHSWIDDAACAKPGVDPEWFWPTTGGGHQTVEAARFVCAGCPVKEMCDLDTKVSGENDGVRAGLTAYQRGRRSGQRAAATARATEAA